MAGNLPCHQGQRKQKKPMLHTWRSWTSAALCLLLAGCAAGPMEQRSAIVLSTALAAAGVMMQGTVVELSASQSLDAARLSLESGLAMADAIILATARSHEAVLWTQDAHFDRMDGVEFRPKR